MEGHKSKQITIERGDPLAILIRAHKNRRYQCLEDGNKTWHVC